MDFRNTGGAFDRSRRNPAEAGPDFAPAPGMFPAAQAVAHAPRAWRGSPREPSSLRALPRTGNRWTADRPGRAVPSLTEARRWLHPAFAAGKAAIASHSPAEWEVPLPHGSVMGGVPRFAILGAIRDHTAHHRGALAVYTRLRGKVPPMPYVEAPQG